MHHTVVIVRYAMIVSRRWKVAIEVVLFARYYGSVVNIQVEITIGATLHMNEPEGMQQLVDDGATGHAAVRWQVDGLLRSSIAYPSRTDSRVSFLVVKLRQIRGLTRLCISPHGLKCANTYRNENVTILGSARYKPDAAHLLDPIHCRANAILVNGIC